MLHELFHPLGYGVEIATDSDAVLAAADQSWGAWSPIFDQPPLRLEIEAHRGAAPRRAPRFEAPAGRLVFATDPGNFGFFSLVSHSGYLMAGTGAGFDAGRFRHNLLEPLVLSALDSVFFTPLHAACVARDGGEGILLCGDSGAGKSTLSYACARRGWTLISDDAFHLAPGLDRVGVGGSNLIHLRRAAIGLFPEIDALEIGIAPNGKRAIEIDASARGFRTSRTAAASQCFFLSRKRGRPEFRPFPLETALRYFLKYLYPRNTAAAEAHLREFLTIEPLLLSYEHADDAVDALEAFTGAFRSGKEQACLR